MTCIVGLEHQGAVYIGGDSGASNSYSTRPTALQKVFRVAAGTAHPFLIGYTSSFRMGQLLQYHLEIPEQGEGEDDLAYLVTRFVPVVRECLKEGGYTKVDNNVEEGGFFLVGYNGKLYQVESDFQVQRHAEGYDAVGSGRDFALGAMLALARHSDGDTQYSPQERIRRALVAAAHFSSAVCPPFYIEGLGGAEG